jgi:hypothetical protein
MSNDIKMIFEKYKEVLNEAYYAGSRHGIKKQAGVHTRNTATSDAEQQRAFNTRFTEQLRKEKEEGKIYNLIELLAPHFKGDIETAIEKARKAIIKFTGNNGKNYLNNFPEELGEYVIPNFRLPDVLGMIEIEMTEPGKEKIGKLIFDKLDEIRQQNGIQKPFRSFTSKEVERTFSDGEGGTIKKTVQVPAIFGGESEVDREQGSHIHVTNSREGEGENERRLKKYKDKSFTFDPRSNPDEHDSSSHTPERRTPENLAGKTMGNRFDDIEDELLKARQEGDVIAQDEISQKLKTRNKTKTSITPKKKKTPSKKQEPKKKKKPTTPTPKEEPKKKKKPTTPKKKKKPVKESYQRFIRVIPF